MRVMFSVDMISELEDITSPSDFLLYVTKTRLDNRRKAYWAVKKSKLIRFWALLKHGGFNGVLLLLLGGSASFQ